ncbi:TPA: hypothetical protein UOJ00_002964 [Stenotrophomonas maltophilia]|nr:hypothetical protein [Stenotrophomonas maltophilia]
MKTNKTHASVEATQESDVIVLGAANVVTKGPASGKEPIGDGNFAGVSGISAE